MERFKTPTLIPGAVYLTYTSDDTMRPVFIQPTHVEPDRNGVWTAILPDSAMGARRVKEGDKLFSFYARVQSPVDRDNPVLLEEGEMFAQAQEEREMMEAQKRLDEKRKQLRIARMTAGGTR